MSVTFVLREFAFSTSFDFFHNKLLLVCFFLYVSLMLARGLQPGIIKETADKSSLHSRCNRSWIFVTYYVLTTQLQIDYHSKNKLMNFVIQTSLYYDKLATKPISMFYLLGINSNACLLQKNVETLLTTRYLIRPSWE